MALPVQVRPPVPNFDRAGSIPARGTNYNFDVITIGTTK